MGRKQKSVCGPSVRRGCQCKKSCCVQNYCECYKAKILCGSDCKCEGCRNNQENIDAREVQPKPSIPLPWPVANGKVEAKAAVKHAMEETEIAPIESLSLDFEILDISVEDFCGTPTLNYVTNAALGNAISCMLSEAVLCEKMNFSPQLTENIIIHRFGECMAELQFYINKKNKEDKLMYYTKKT